MTVVTIHVAGFSDSDDAERVSLARELRTHLLRDPLIEGILESSADRPAGAKGLGVDIATLVVTFTGGLPGIVESIETWRNRRPPGAVAVEIDGDRMELGDSSPAERARLIEWWLERHKAK